MVEQHFPFVYIRKNAQIAILVCLLNWKNTHIIERNNYPNESGEYNFYDFLILESTTFKIYNLSSIANFIQIQHIISI